MPNKSSRTTLVTLNVKLKTHRMVVIIGAGMAGLTCAKYLNDRQIPFVILEASDGVGGRVRTDTVDGFQLDRGFQIFLTSYPEAKKILDYDALDFKPFRSGAIIRKDGKLFTMPNPLKNPLSAPQALAAPVGTLRDKLKILQLNRKVGRDENSVFFKGQTPRSTLAFLSGFGYSEEMINTFFRPFFSGVFLEKELLTADNFFRFLFKQFAAGDAVLPARGIQAIPEQLAARLPKDSIRLKAQVWKLDGQTLYLTNGQTIDAQTIVIATNAIEADNLLPQHNTATEFNGTECVYFSADRSPLTKPMIAVNADADGLVNNLAVLSDAADSYAPPGKTLVSVTVVGKSGLSGTELAHQVQRELAGWFGDQTRHWQHLHTYRIPHALPQYFPDTATPLPLKINDFTYRCGDYTAYPSLNAAMQTGREVAEMIAASR